MRLPQQTAKQLVTDWVRTCRTIAAKRNATPFIALSGADDHYLAILEQMLADKLEEIIAELNQNP